MTASACSPYRFGTEIAAFSDGVTALSDSLASSSTVLEQDRVLFDRLDRARTRPQLTLSDSCNARLTADDPPCTVQDYRSPAPITPVANITVAQAAAKLRDYADGLKAITVAKDRADLDAASAKLAAGVQGLTAGIPALSALPAVVSGGLWLFGEALDAERMHRLKQAVNQAQPSIAALANLMGAPLPAIQAQRAALLRNTAHLIAKDMTRSIARDDWLARDRLLEERVAALDSVMRADPLKTTQSLVAAHQALVNAVNDPTTDLATLRQTVKAFADQAGALRDAFKRR